MTLQEYQAKMLAAEDWAPGWEAIEAQFARVYPAQEPEHFGTLLPSRAILGGDQYLDGFSIYTSPHGFRHMVTYGMSRLYADEEAFGQEWSGWGYEMTFALPAPDADSCKWVIDMLSNLARYTYGNKRFFEPYQFVQGQGSICLEQPGSTITSLLCVPDTQVQGADTPHGRLEFIQLVGITDQELAAVKEDPDRAKTLADNLQRDYPWLQTDLARTKPYL